MHIHVRYASLAEGNTDPTSTGRTALYAAISKKIRGLQPMPSLYRLSDTSGSIADDDQL